MYLDGNLVWKISLEIIYGNLVGNFDPWKLDPWKFNFKIQMEIQLGKFVGNLDRNLDGNFDLWNFLSLEISMEIYF